MFGHVPLLAQPAIADFMQAMGAEGLAALEAGALHRLARLYWYSVEFGLAREDGETRIYGAGLLSSFGESRFALEDPKPRRAPFDLRQVLRTRYRSDAFQQGYFVIDSFDALLRVLTDADLAALYRELDGTEDPDLGWDLDFRGRKGRWIRRPRACRSRARGAFAGRCRRGRAASRAVPGRARCRA